MERQRWAGVAGAYRRSFARLCAGTLETVLADVGSPPGRLLDVGCGVGGLSRRAAGRGWAVTGVDPDAQMLALARQECEGLAACWLQAALPRLGLPAGTFDVVAANFVVNHLPDPRAGVRELARVVRPGGAVALTSWVAGRTAQVTLFTDASAAARAVAVPGERLPPELDFDRTPDGLAGLCRETGLEPVTSRELAWEWAVAWDDLWAGITAGVGALGQSYLAQDAATRERVRQEFRRRTADLETDGLVRLPSVAAYVLARRA